MDFDIEIEIDGIRYFGCYNYDEIMVSVNYDGKERHSQIDGYSANIEKLAKQLLRSLVKSEQKMKNSS